MTLHEIADYPYSIDNPDPENPSGCWPESLLKSIEHSNKIGSDKLVPAPKEESSDIRKYILEMCKDVDIYRKMRKHQTPRGKGLLKKSMNKPGPIIRNIRITNTNTD